MNNRQREDLDRHITGHYGEDSVPDDERDDEVYCTNLQCSWMGMREELVALTDDENDLDFSFCPRCNSETDDL